MWVGAVQSGRFVVVVVKSQNNKLQTQRKRQKLKQPQVAGVRWFLAAEEEKLGF
jgi:hypothetical protein